MCNDIDSTWEDFIDSRKVSTDDNINDIYDDTRNYMVDVMKSWSHISNTPFYDEDFSYKNPIYSRIMADRLYGNDDAILRPEECYGEFDGSPEKDLSPANSRREFQHQFDTHVKYMMQGGDSNNVVSDTQLSPDNQYDFFRGMHKELNERKNFFDKQDTSVIHNRFTKMPKDILQNMSIDEFSPLKISQSYIINEKPINLSNDVIPINQIKHEKLMSKKSYIQDTRSIQNPSTHSDIRNMVAEQKLHGGYKTNSRLSILFDLTKQHTSISHHIKEKMVFNSKDSQSQKLSSDILSYGKNIETPMYDTHQIANIVSKAASIPKSFQIFITDSQKIAHNEFDVSKVKRAAKYVVPATTSEKIAHEDIITLSTDAVSNSKKLDKFDCDLIRNTIQAKLRDSYKINPRVQSKNVFDKNAIYQYIDNTSDIRDKYIPIMKGKNVLPINESDINRLVSTDITLDQSYINKSSYTKLSKDVAHIQREAIIFE